MKLFTDIPVERWTEVNLNAYIDILADKQIDVNLNAQSPLYSWE